MTKENLKTFNGMMEQQFGIPADLPELKNAKIDMIKSDMIDLQIKISALHDEIFLAKQKQKDAISILSVMTKELTALLENEQ